MPTTTALRYVDLLAFDSPFAILIKNARQDQEWTDRKIQAIRLATQSGEPYTAEMRAEVRGCSLVQANAVWLEDTCKQIIERRANQQGLTTVRSESDMGI